MAHSAHSTIRFERLLFTRGLTIGVALTMMVLVAQRVGLLESLDNWFYDQRASLCQFFAPKPSDQIIHIDIDDASYEAIGHWPWPRATQAQLFDEIARAQPKAVAIDILYGEPEPAHYVAGDGPAPRWIDGDALLAASLGRLEAPLLATSFVLTPAQTPPPIETAAVELISQNLEITSEQLSAQLKNRRFPTGSEESTNALFIGSRRIAMRQRVAREFQRAPIARDRLIAVLLPHTDPTVNSPLLGVLDQTCATLNAERQLRRFGAPDPHLAVPAVGGTPTVIPFVPFMDHAQSCAFVEYDIFNSPTVRSAPLFLEFENRLYPQIGLALGCALLDADVHKARFENNRVIIPHPSGPDISIPTRRYHAKSLGKDVSLIAYIPWFGNHDWRTMYDWPAHRESANHISMTKVSDIYQTRDKIIQNNRNIDKAISLMLDDDVPNKAALNPELAHKYASTPRPPDDSLAREQMAQRTLKELADSGWLERYDQIPDKDLKPEERQQRDDIHEAVRAALHTAVEQNQALTAQLVSLRTALKNRLKGKGALIGWTATGTADLVSTSLHARCPGIVVHGVIANAVLTGRWWRDAPPWVGLALILCMGFATAGFDASVSPARGTFLTLALITAYLLVNGLLVFDCGAWIVPIAGPVAAVAVVWAGCTLCRLIVEGMERNRIATEVAVISREMELARQVQVALIPPRPPTVAGLEAEGWALTASMTGGDCFDLWEMHDGRLAILLADASGHGLAPAMVVSQVRTLVRAMCELEPHPQDLLARVNARLADDLEPNRFVTAFLGFLTPDGKLEWSSAGHGPMFWCANSTSGMLPLESTALPLGIQSDWLGDDPGPPLLLDGTGMIVVFSDGIFEAPAPDGEMFGIDRVKDVLHNGCHKCCSEIIADLRNAVQKWQGKVEPIDDQTIVIARRLLVPSEPGASADCGPAPTVFITNTPTAL